MEQQEVILVSAPNKTGEGFILQLLKQGLRFAAIANNQGEKQRLVNIGVKNIVMVDTTEQINWTLPEFTIGKVFIFERSLNLCCRYIQMCRRWTSKPIYVITHTSNPRLVYKGLGAAYVIHTTSEDVSFLIQTHVK
ncbi:MULTISPECIES: hypothetical protein [Paenibacillus]|jgi:hypothetical protein|uniref:Response regulator transcription factor n=1 Tax=Paenibacillus baimaensis TaxID=2982185 RepID=A0ABT2UU86_9BACL|nr:MULTISPECIES: hypothetical protein [unclassified Paenibacillus]MCU6798209.1 hypothetical protein [Paenibacillus sp. WQ 127069]OMF05918.1 hypothetical protein BK127_31900 [Paenibacillus sp. FSL H7-0331]